MQNKGQINVVYMSYFVLLGMVFLGFVFTFSGSFRDDSAEELSEYLAESIFARIEKASLELRAINDQTSANDTTKTISVPRRLGDSDYQIIGKNTTLIISSSGSNAFYKTKTIYWQDLQFEGSANSQNSEINMFYNSTSHKIRIS